MLSLIGSAFSFLAGVISWLTGWEQRKAGREEQQLADTKSEAATLERERDAALNGDSVDEAARKGTL